MTTKMAIMLWMRIQRMNLLKGRMWNAFTWQWLILVTSLGRRRAASSTPELCANCCVKKTRLGLPYDMLPPTMRNEGIISSGMPSGRPFVNTISRWRDISVLSKGTSVKLATRIHWSGNCWKKFSRSEVKGQGHDQTKCYNGGGVRFDAG